MSLKRIQKSPKIVILLSSISLVFNTQMTLAATQGTLGNTSSGSVSISVTKSAVAQIAGLTDLTLSSYVLGAGDQTISTTACIFSNTINGGYKVTATGNGGAGNGYKLSNISGQMIPYTVVWNAGGVNKLGTTGTTLSSGVQSAQLTNAATDSPTCAGTIPGPTAQINVKLSGSSLDNAPNGAYTGILTIVINPV